MFDLSCSLWYVFLCLYVDGVLNGTTYVMPTSENELAWASLQFAVTTHAHFIFR